MFFFCLFWKLRSKIKIWIVSIEPHQEMNSQTNIQPMFRRSLPVCHAVLPGLQSPGTEAAERWRGWRGRRGTAAFLDSALWQPVPTRHQWEPVSAVPMASWKEKKNPPDGVASTSGLVQSRRAALSPPSTWTGVGHCCRLPRVYIIVFVGGHDFFFFY